MNIKEFSVEAGLSPHTLRYYEKIGLLRDVQRGANGHRFYTSKDLEWIKFIVRLKETGMHLDKINDYADLRAKGDSTMLERKVLLEEHHYELKKSIELQLEHLSALEQKINIYNQQISS